MLHLVVTLLAVTLDALGRQRSVSHTSDCCIRVVEGTCRAERIKYRLIDCS